MSLKYLSQKEAINLDIELMSKDFGFRMEQLMELAGLSVSQCCFKEFPVEKFPNPLIIVGPGNNGGDGLVCARHLYHYGYKPTILQPKPPKKDLYKDLNKQCDELNIPIISDMDKIDEEKYSYIVDGIFGFSFKGTPRKPFDKIIKIVNTSNLKKLSIDVPSGWDVEKGKVSDLSIEADVLISLSAPKMCAKNYKGKHYLGGRFIPIKLSEKYDLNLPKYKDLDQIVEISGV